MWVAVNQIRQDILKKELNRARAIEEENFEDHIEIGEPFFLFEN